MSCMTLRTMSNVFEQKCEHVHRYAIHTHTVKLSISDRFRLEEVKIALRRLVEEVIGFLIETALTRKGN